MAKRPDLNRIINLYGLLVEFRGVKRALRIPPELTDYENDVEHSYNLAMIGWFLSEYFPELDSNKVVKIALAHDLVEVHAGDTFAFSVQEVLDKKEIKELEAFEKIKDDWKDFPDMCLAIEEYKSRSSPEASFVYALDKLIPAIMNYIGDGHVWKEHNLGLEDVMKEKETKIPANSAIKLYWDQLYKLLKENPQLFPIKGSER